MAVNDLIAIASTDRGDTGRLKPHVMTALNFPDVNRQKMTRMLTRLKIQRVPRMTYEVQEEWDPNREIGVTAASAAASTTVVVDDFTGIVEGMEFSIVDNAGDSLDFNIRVDATPTTTSVTITRPWQLEGSDATIPVGAKLRLINNTRSEDDVKPDVRVRATNRVTQSCVTIARGVAITGHMKSAQMYGPKEEARLSAQQVRMFGRDVENTVKFDLQGTVNTGTTGETVWNTDGHRHYGKRWNWLDAGGTLDRRAFVDIIQQSNRLGGEGVKTIFCSNSMAAGFAEWGHSHGIVRQDAARKRLGFMIDTIDIPGIAAPVDVVVDEDYEGLNEMAIVDFRGLRLAEHRPLEIERGIQTNGQDRNEWKMTRSIGLMCTKPWSQGYITNAKRIVA